LTVAHKMAVREIRFDESFPILSSAFRTAN
jgi:hypothetical protein